MSSNRHTLRRVFINKTWLGSVRQICLVVAWLGLASVRLYYTAPYRFLVSMFRAPVLLSYTGFAWAWLGLSLRNVPTHLNINTRRKGHTISLPMICIVIPLYCRLPDELEGCATAGTRHYPCPQQLHPSSRIYK